MGQDGRLAACMHQIAERGALILVSTVLDSFPDEVHPAEAVILVVVEEPVEGRRLLLDP
jgi:hypothetical protein